MSIVLGFFAGLAFYCATAFPFAALAHTTGSLWPAVFMLYGVICGSVGTAWGMLRS